MVFKIITICNNNFLRDHPSVVCGGFSLRPKVNCGVPAAAHRFVLQGTAGRTKQPVQVGWFMRIRVKSRLRWPRLRWYWFAAIRASVPWIVGAGVIR